MRKVPIIGDLVQIFESIENTNCGIEMHIVQCTSYSPSSNTEKFFWGVHSRNGKLCAFKLKQINRILEGEEYNKALKEFNQKQGKAATHEY